MKIIKSTKTGRISFADIPTGTVFKLLEKCEGIGPDDFYLKVCHVFDENDCDDDDDYNNEEDACDAFNLITNELIDYLPNDTECIQYLNTELHVKV